MLRRKTDGVIVVKEKETVNSLKSLSIVPPKKTTYIVGEKLDVTGMKVTANYTKRTKKKLKIIQYQDLIQQNQENIM